MKRNFLPARLAILAGLVILSLTNCKKALVVTSNNTDQNIDKNKDETSGAVQTSLPGTLDVYPGLSAASLQNTEHIKKSADYTVEVKKPGSSTYVPVFVYTSDNYWDPTPLFGNAPKRPQTAAHFTSFGLSGTAVDVRITTNFTANTVKVRPFNYGINAVKNGNVITFTISDTTKLSVEVNGRNNPLFIFAEKPEVVPSQSSVTYFYGPGTYNIGLRKPLHSGDKVYIAGGAVVEGSFLIDYNAQNVSIKGRGILSMGQWPTYPSIGYNDLKDNSMIRSWTTSKLRMEGLILANSNAWTISIESDPVAAPAQFNEFKNLKIINWKFCTDGIWYDGNGHTINDCFIFNNDDMLMTHGSTNCTIKNIVGWGGIGGSLCMFSDYINSSNLTFTNINLLGKDGGTSVIRVEAQKELVKSLSDITFTNLRVEEHKVIPGGYHVNKFFRIYPTYENGKILKSNISNWRFEGVSLDDHASGQDEGDIYGSPNYTVNGVTFKNFRIQGNLITNIANSFMDANSYASNVQFIP